MEDLQIERRVQIIVVKLDLAHSIVEHASLAYSYLIQLMHGTVHYVKYCDFGTASSEPNTRVIHLRAHTMTNGAFELDPLTTRTMV